MLVITDKTACSGCHACYSACPRKCIEMVSDDEGFLYPQADGDKCIHCGLCKTVCPILHPIEIQTHQAQKGYAAINKNEDIRRESSSGGVFTLIAEYVIGRGGVVFGAVLDENMDVVHRYAETTAELAQFRGSKYVQSRMGDSYLLAKRFLEEGRTVLFTGTPCQIAGLTAYLRKPYANLLTQDIICHGVPSPMVWHRYVRYREEKAGAKVQKIRFRHKRFGWKNHSLLFAFDNQTECVQDVTKDLYLRGFLADLCLRPSCYACRFKGIQRVSDLTLADYWGVSLDLSQMDDDKGTSLVILHTEKGKQLFDAVCAELRCADADIDTAVQHNPSMIRSSGLPKNRDGFMHDVAAIPFDKALKKHLRVPATVQTRRFIRKVLSKLKRMINRKNG